MRALSIGWVGFAAVVAAGCIQPVNVIDPPPSPEYRFSTSETTLVFLKDRRRVVVSYIDQGLPGRTTAGVSFSDNLGRTWTRSSIPLGTVPQILSDPWMTTNEAATSAAYFAMASYSSTARIANAIAISTGDGATWAPFRLATAVAQGRCLDKPTASATGSTMATVFSTYACDQDVASGFTMIATSDDSGATFTSQRLNLPVSFTDYNENHIVRLVNPFYGFVAFMRTERSGPAGEKAFRPNIFAISRTTLGGEWTATPVFAGPRASVQILLPGAQDDIRRRRWRDGIPMSFGVGRGITRPNSPGNDHVYVTWRSTTATNSSEVFLGDCIVDRLDGCGVVAELGGARTRSLQDLGITAVTGYQPGVVAEPARDEMVLTWYEDRGLNALRDPTVTASGVVFQNLSVDATRVGPLDLSPSNRWSPCPNPGGFYGDYFGTTFTGTGVVPVAQGASIVFTPPLVTAYTNSSRGCVTDQFDQHVQASTW